MFIGNNLNGPTYYTNAWQFCDIMKNSTCWSIRGSDPIDRDRYDINFQDHIIFLTEGVEFEKIVAFTNGDPTIPLVGEYTILAPGMANSDYEYSVLYQSGSQSIDWTSEEVVTFNATAPGSIFVRARLKPGITESTQAFENFAIIVPGELERYQAGATFRKEWLDFQKQFNWHTLRFMDWANINDNLREHWSERTLPTALSWAGTKGWLSQVRPVLGSGYVPTFNMCVPIEIRLELCRELNAGIWVTPPNRSTDDYLRSLAQAIREGLPVGSPIQAEGPGNERWNAQFGDIQRWTAYLDEHEILEAEGIDGDGFARSPGNGLSDGDEIFAIQHRETDSKAIWQVTNDFYGPGKLIARNPTDEGFFMEDFESGEMRTFGLGLNKFYWVRVDEDDDNNNWTPTELAENSGRDAVRFWDIFQEELGDDYDILEGVNVQFTYPGVSLAAFGPNGTNGRGAVFGAPYFNIGMGGWFSGITNAEMLENDREAIARLKAHIDTYRAEGLDVYAYEGNGHLVTEGEADGDQALEYFRQYVNSPEYGIATQEWLQALSDAGMKGICYFVGDVNPHGPFGFWGIANSWAETDNPRAEVLKQFAGFVEPSAPVPPVEPIDPVDPPPEPPMISDYNYIVSDNTPPEGVDHAPAEAVSTIIRSSSPDYVHGDNEETFGGAGIIDEGITKMLIVMNAPAIPENMTAEKVTLRVHSGGGFDGDLPLELGVKKLTDSDWNPQTTTYNREYTDPDTGLNLLWIEPGAEANTDQSIPAVYQPVGSGPGYFDWDVTDMVRPAVGLVSFLVTPLEGTQGYRNLFNHLAPDGDRMELLYSLVEVVEPVDPVDPPADPVEPDPVDPPVETVATSFSLITNDSGLVTKIRVSGDSMPTQEISVDSTIIDGE